MRFTYDDEGRMTGMTTYRDESGPGDTTAWTYDPATGLLIQKVYDDGKGPTYTYTPDGKLATRTWARGVTSTYAYDGWGNLTNVVHSDGTPSVSMAYDFMGRQIETSGKFWGLSPKLSLRGVVGCGRVVQMKGDAL